MGHRRLNPLSWRLSTINIVFATTITALLTFYFTLSTPSFATEPPIAFLTIPTANLDRSEIVHAPPTGNLLPTPDLQIGLYKPHQNLTFLYAHSSTAFIDLPLVAIGDQITIQDLETNATTTYTIASKQLQKLEEVSMRDLLAAPSQNTLILMTCAGTHNPATDTYDHRLIIHALAI